MVTAWDADLIGGKGISGRGNIEAEVRSVWPGQETISNVGAQGVRWGQDGEEVVCRKKRLEGTKGQREEGHRATAS